MVFGTIKENNCFNFLACVPDHLKRKVSGLCNFRNFYDLKISSLFRVSQLSGHSIPSVPKSLEKFMQIVMRIRMLRTNLATLSQ